MTSQPVPSSLDSAPGSIDRHDWTPVIVLRQYLSSNSSGERWPTSECSRARLRKISIWSRTAKRVPLVVRSPEGPVDGLGLKTREETLGQRVEASIVVKWTVLALEPHGILG